MSITTKKTTITLAASAALSAGLMLSPMMASADTNPFASTELSSGYMQLAEGGCGANKEAKKDTEAKCGANKAASHADKTAKKGKHGEAKCGAEMKEKMKHGEAKHGAEKKEKMKEGSCGSKK